MIVFGPVPSRRLGRSLGVNNIPKKICSYNCVYCQVGKTGTCLTSRREFYDPDTIEKEVEERLKRTEADYITFVPDGEPTLDSNLGREIELLKPLGRVAVITNSSLLSREDVREDLSKADLVSIKLDAVSERTWLKINRPCRGISLKDVLAGIEEFSKSYGGRLITETMIVRGLNTNLQELESVADFLKTVSPDRAYISIPTRPPAEGWVSPPTREEQDMAYTVFHSRGLNVEMLNRKETGEFELGRDPERGLLAILEVHPMRMDSVERILSENELGWDLVERLLRDGKIESIEYNGERYFRAL